VLARALGLSCASLTISTRAKAGELVLRRSICGISSRLGFRSDLPRPVVRQQVCWRYRGGLYRRACALKAVWALRLVTRPGCTTTIPAWSGVCRPFCRVSLVILSNVPHGQVIWRDLVYGVAAMILSRP
jgi:hypothetical protein